MDYPAVRIRGPTLRHGASFTGRRFSFDSARGPWRTHASPARIPLNAKSPGTWPGLRIGTGDSTQRPLPFYVCESKTSEACLQCCYLKHLRVHLHSMEKFCPIDIISSISKFLDIQAASRISPRHRPTADSAVLSRSLQTSKHACTNGSHSRAKLSLASRHPFS